VQRSLRKVCRREGLLESSKFCFVSFAEFEFGKYLVCGREWKLEMGDIIFS
jgi:hypothetical protein